MDIEELLLSTLILTFFLIVLILGVLFYIHIENEYETQIIAIKNRCEYNSQTFVWTNCKGHLNREIE